MAQLNDLLVMGQSTLLGPSTIHGLMTFMHDRPAINFRSGSTSYDAIISYQTYGNEALVFSTKNNVTSFIFVNNEDTKTNLTSNRWQSLTPALQIKQNCVVVGKLLGHNTAPTCKFEVSGKSLFTGEVQVTGQIFGYNYNVSTSSFGNNSPAIVFDKPGRNYTGIGACGEDHTIYFGDTARDSTTNKFVWKNEQSQIWKFNGVVKALGEVQSTSANAFRMIYGDYGVFWRNDGSNTYLLMTNSKDQYGSWNDLRPFYVSNSTGRITCAQGISVGGYSNTDYVLSTNNFICNSWVRTIGDAGWFSQTHGGGIYMIDSTWVRTYNDKNFYCSKVIQAGDRIFVGFDSEAAGSISCSNWFRTNGDCGWYNHKHECHIQPNTKSSYGSVAIHGGAKTGYQGVHLGPDKTYLTVMSSVPHQGLYNEDKGRWIVYYNQANDNISLGMAQTTATTEVLTIGCTSRLTADMRLVGTQIKKTGTSTLWAGGRWVAPFRMDTINGYSASVSTKSSNGSWELGCYHANGYYDDLVFTYVPDQCAGTGLGDAVNSKTVDGVTYSFINALRLTKDGAVKAVSFYASSDKRLKENLMPFVSKKSILDLPIYTFDFINGTKNQIGCMAQDLQEICPEIVSEDNEGYLSISESKIVYLLIDEVKKLKLELQALKGE